MLDQDLHGCSLADVLEKLEAGKIGHSTAMRWLEIDSYNKLVKIMHFNGRTRPGHRPMIVTLETIELIRQISKPLKKPAKS